MRLTDFIGREEDLAELARLLQRARLVTLTGPGGAGKTRLAVELAARVSGLFLDGVFLVDLAPLADPALVVRALAQATGTIDQPQVTPLEAVAGRLERARALLLLDNCEHLIDAAATAVEALLTQTEDLRVVATSREALDLDGEAVWRLGPLPAAEALCLFVNRAELAAPGRSIDEAVAAEICTRLDGLPLGIELAAARAGTMSLEEIRNRLDDRFRLLVTGARRNPARQRTLEAAVEWSYDLLEEADRAIFRRLAVFTGGFDLEAAQAVCGLGSQDALARLVNKSLVVPDTTGPRTRYSLLETLREFATARLRDAGEEATARAAHAAHNAGIAQQSLDATITPAQMAWLVRTEQESANLRVALDFLARSGNDRALLLASALGNLAFFRGHRYAQAEELNALLGRREWPAGRPLATATTQLAWLQCDDHADAALRSAQRALALWHDLGDTPGEQWALTTVGYICIRLGDVDMAEAFAGQALALAEAHGLSPRLALQVLGIAASRRGHLEHARDLLERARAQAEKDGDAGGQGASTGWLARVTLALGDRDKAERLFEHVLAVAPGMHASFAGLMHLAQLALDRGNRVLARTRWLECLEAIRRQHRVDDLPDCLDGLARLAAAEHDRSRATRLAELAADVRSGTCPAVDAIAYAQGTPRSSGHPGGLTLRRLLLVLLTSLTLIPGAGVRTVPTATQVLSMPSRSGAHDARLAISGYVTVAGIAIPLEGEGLMAFGAKPAMAAKVVLRIAGEEQVVEEVAVNGISYSRTGSAPWQEELDIRINQPDRWRQARAVAMLPPDRLSLGDAWHVAAISPQGHRFDAWVRQRDGYPLRFALRDPDGLLVIDFHDFDCGAVIIGPMD